MIGITIKKDLNKLPIEGITGENSEDEILAILSKYGIRRIEQEGHFEPKGEISKAKSELSRGMGLRQTPDANSYGAKTWQMPVYISWRM